MDADEKLPLSEEILKNIELEEMPFFSILLKCQRLARISNDIDALEWFTQEIIGFESGDGGLTEKGASAASRSNRQTIHTDPKTQEKSRKFFTQTLSSIEKELESHEIRAKLNGPNVHAIERNTSQAKIRDLSSLYQKIKGSVYSYVMNFNYNLKYGNITESIFDQKRTFVDLKLKEICPDAISKFVSVYNNLRSDNEEDWANSVHSCRRILKDLADSIYPPSEIDVVTSGKKIKVGNENYVNRLMLFIESKEGGNSFESIVGSHLKYIGERIDSIYEAANKGTHSSVQKSEAERYIIYTYIIISDILQLV